MKIVSSFMDDINLKDGECHTIYFESSQLQMEFRYLFDGFIKNKHVSDTRYLKLLEKDLNVYKRRKLYPIIFECNIINLQLERSTEKIIKDFIEYQLNNNPELLEKFLEFNDQLERFLWNIDIESNDLLVDFSISDKTISQFIKSLNIEITSNSNKFLTNHTLRNFLIKLLLQLNIHHKEVLLVVTYPESDIGGNDYSKIVSEIEQHNVTTLILTSNEKILTSVPLENIFMIDSKGEKYDMIGLKRELSIFKLVGQRQLVDISKKLAYLDFVKDYELLDPTFRRFLISNKH